VLPFSIVFYLAGSRRRRARAAQAASRTADGTPVVPVAGHVAGADGGAAGDARDGGR
jgi:hypothetical protein